MKRTQQFAVVALVSMFVLAIALPAFAAQDSTEGETTETTVAAEHDHLGPAVPAPPPEVVDEEQPWTARFIYPTIVAVTVILLIGLAIGYNRSIKKRYTVVG
jgi:hypothetical protein